MKTYKITVKNTYTVSAENPNNAIYNKIEDIIEIIKINIGQFIHDCEFDIEEFPSEEELLDNYKIDNKICKIVESMFDSYEYMDAWEEENDDYRILFGGYGQDQKYFELSYSIEEKSIIITEVINVPVQNVLAILQEVRKELGYS